MRGQNIQSPAREPLGGTAGVLVSRLLIGPMLFVIQPLLPSHALAVQHELLVVAPAATVKVEVGRGAGGGSRGGRRACKSVGSLTKVIAFGCEIVEAMALASMISSEMSNESAIDFATDQLCSVTDGSSTASLKISSIERWVSRLSASSARIRGAGTTQQSIPTNYRARAHARQPSGGGARWVRVAAADTTMMNHGRKMHSSSRPKSMAPPTVGT